VELRLGDLSRAGLGWAGPDLDSESRIELRFYIWCHCHCNFAIIFSSV